MRFSWSLGPSPRGPKCILAVERRADRWLHVKRKATSLCHHPNSSTVLLAACVDKTFNVEPPLLGSITSHDSSRQIWAEINDFGRWILKSIFFRSTVLHLQATYSDVFVLRIEKQKAETRNWTAQETASGRKISERRIAQLAESSIDQSGNFNVRRIYNVYLMKKLRWTAKDGQRKNENQGTGTRKP